MNPIITAIAGPLVNLIAKRGERKASLDSIKAQAELSKQNGDHEIKIKRSDWENNSKKMEGDSLKDEYAVLIVTSPIVVMFVGCIFSAFGNERVLAAGQMMIQTFTDNGIDYGILLYITITAALGIRVMKP